MNNNNNNIFEYLRITFRDGGIAAYGAVILRILNGIIPSLQVLILAKFIDDAKLLFDENLNRHNLFFWGGLLVLSITYQWFSNQIQFLFQVKIVCNLRIKFRTKLTNKCVKLKYSAIENEEIQNRNLRVMKDPENEVCNGFLLIFDFISILIRLAGISIIIMNKELLCGVFLLLLNIPIIILSKKNGKEIYQADKDVSLYIRKYEYLDEILTGKDANEERMIFGFHDFINNFWLENYNVAYKKQIKAFFSYFFKTRVYSIATVVISLLMVALLVEPLLAGTISIGLFMAIVSNIITVVVVVIQQLSTYTREMTKKKEYMNDLSEMLNQDEDEEGVLAIPDTESIILKTIEFRNVRFKYPNTSSYAIKNINLKIEANKHYALVGENGAGKTTVVKLLTGLYRDYEGEILINDKELREYTVPQIKALISVVYQDFAQYNISIYNNIAIGDMRINLNHIRKQRVSRIISKLNMNKFIDTFNKTTDTVLGKLDEECQDISLGQWQRIGIARAFMKDVPLRILDEPTASLDPISENQIYQEYNQLSKDTTTIFISHRLGAITLADEVVVFDNGEIIESGTFSELMSKDGKFNSMYEKQRSWYQ